MLNSGRYNSLYLYYKTLSLLTSPYSNIWKTMKICIKMKVSISPCPWVSLKCFLTIDVIIVTPIICQSRNKHQIRTTTTSTVIWIITTTVWKYIKDKILYCILLFSSTFSYMTTALFDCNVVWLLRIEEIICWYDNI